MHVELVMSGQKVMDLVDNRATHNFVATWEVARLSLKLSKDDSKLKVVNNQA